MIVSNNKQVFVRQNRLSGEGKSNSSRVWFYYILALGLYAAIFTFWQAQSVPLEVHFLGILFAALCGFPMARWYTQQVQQTPIFEILCLAYGFQYGTPLYIQFNEIFLLGRRIPFAWEDTSRTLLLIILGVGVMIICYYLVHGSKFMQGLPTFDLPLAQHKRSSYLLIALIIGLGVGLLRTTMPNFISNSNLDAFISLMFSHSYIAIALLAYYLYTHKMAKKWYLFLIGAVALSAITGLTTGMLQDTLIPFVLVFCIIWQVTRKLPWYLLIAGLLLFLILQPVKSAYRAQAWTNNDIGLLERIQLWMGLAQDAVGSEGLISNVTTVRMSMIRFDLLHTSELVQKMTPTYVPYYEGRSYSYLMIGWIPRFLWPNKPIAQEANNIFAVDYGIMKTSQVGYTMTGIGHIAEAFANFGVLGVIVVMGLQGMIFATLNHSLNGEESEGGRAIYLSIMVFFLNGMGSATAGFFAALIQTIVAQALFLRLFCNGFSARPAIKYAFLTAKMSRLNGQVTTDRSNSDSV